MAVVVFLHVSGFTVCEPTQQYSVIHDKTQDKTTLNTTQQNRNQTKRKKRNKAEQNKTEQNTTLQHTVTFISSWIEDSKIDNILKKYNK